MSMQMPTKVGENKSEETACPVIEALNAKPVVDEKFVALVNGYFGKIHSPLRALEDDIRRIATSPTGQYFTPGGREFEKIGYRLSKASVYELVATQDKLESLHDRLYEAGCKGADTVSLYHARQAKVFAKELEVILSRMGVENGNVEGRNSLQCLHHFCTGSGLYAPQQVIARKDWFVPRL